MFRLVFVASLSVACAELVKDWKASLIAPSSAEFYKVVFEWQHDASEAVEVGWMQDSPLDDPRCSGNSSETASDGQPYWMPRFYPRQVSNEIKAQTGIQFASVDWQPCGHKDIAICHGESHYDFHLYYVPEAELAGMSMCDIGTKANPKLPVCLDSPNPANRAYFKLIDHNMPVTAKMSAIGANPTVDKQLNFCVDDSSAILRSGVHYGDKSETLDEWKTPVTIIGSHDCRMLFFEPMISWKWIRGGLKGSSHWPTHQVSDIKYNRKVFDALPHSWSVNVSTDCENASATRPCRIQVIVEGTKCPEGGCALRRECGSMINCATNNTYTAPGSTSAGAYFVPRTMSLAFVAILHVFFQ